MAEPLHESLTDTPDFDWHDTPCPDCRWYIGSEGGRPTCAAFAPKPIPAPILMGEDWHDRPWPGDHGKQREPRLPNTTDGPIRYAVVSETTEDGWTVMGAFWTATDGTAEGFYAARGEALGYSSLLRATQRQGLDVTDLVEYLQPRSNEGLSVGGWMDAPSLDSLVVLTD